MRRRVDSLKVPLPSGRLFSLIAPPHALPLMLEQCGPEALCRARGLEPSAVFPIRYRLAVPFQVDAEPLEAAYAQDFQA